MRGKMTQKHINFSDSIVMKELEKIAIKENLINFEEKIPELKVEASAELKETGDIFVDSITLANSLKEHGFRKQAALLEKRAFEMKIRESDDEEDKYNWWGETGDSLIEDAHRNDKPESLPSSNDYGKIENEVETKRKILETITHQPSGKTSLAYKKKIINEINIIAQEEGAEGGEVVAPDTDKYKGGEVVAPDTDKYSDPNWETMKVQASKVINFGTLAAKEAKMIPSGGIPISKLSKGKDFTPAGKMFIKVTGLDPSYVKKSIILSNLPIIMKIVSGDNPKLYTLGAFNDPNVDATQLANSALFGYGNEIVISKNYPIFVGACKFLDIECNLASKIREIKSLILSLTKAAEGKTPIDTDQDRKIKVKINSILKSLSSDYNRIYKEVRVKYIEKTKLIKDYLNGGALLILKQQIWAASDNLIDGLNSLQPMLVDQLDFLPNDFNQQLDTVIELLNIFTNKLLYSKPLYEVSVKSEEFNEHFESISKNTNNCKLSVSQTRNSLYNYKAFDKSLRLIPNQVKVDIPKMERVRVINDGWLKIRQEAAKISQILPKSDKDKIRTEIKLGDALLKAFENAKNNEPYAHFYKSLPEGLVPKDPRELEATVNKWQTILNNSFKYIQELAKKASRKVNIEKLGTGGEGLGGAGFVPEPASGKKKYVSTGKPQKKLDKTLTYNISKMQEIQQDFVSYVDSQEFIFDAEPDVIETINMAENNLQGTDSDGAWGPRTQTSLESIQKYISVNPKLKNKISDKIYSKQPTSIMSPKEIDRNLKKNITIMVHAQALLGDSKYNKYLSNILKASGFDKIPKVYTVPTKSNKDTFMPDEDGIKISVREISSLKYLKDYLTSKNYSAVSISNVDELK